VGETANVLSNLKAVEILVRFFPFDLEVCDVCCAGTYFDFLDQLLDERSVSLYFDLHVSTAEVPYVTPEIQA